MSRDEWDDVWQDKSTALPEIFRESISLVKKIIRHNIEIENRPPSYSTIQKEEFNNSPFGKGGQGGAIHSQGGMKEGVQSISSLCKGGMKGVKMNCCLLLLI